MADHEIATKAPESDAHEDQSPSVIPGDSTVDQGAASMGEHCTTDRPTPAGETPTGEIAKLNDIDVYISKPADYPHSPSRLLLLLTSGTGIHSTNNQLQADKYAAEGFLVVMPDQFSGQPASQTMNTTTPASPIEETPSLIEQVKLGIASVAKSLSLDMWLAYHTPERVLPILHKVLEAVQEEFADAIAHGDGIYAVGYCFGAKYVLQLGSEDAAARQKSRESQVEEGKVKKTPIKVGVIAHGTQITVQDLDQCRVPVAIVAVQDDSLFPDEIRDQGVEKLKANGVDHEIKVYEGVPHGFAVLGDYDDQTIRTKQSEAFEQMLAWLKKH